MPLFEQGESGNPGGRPKKTAEQRQFEDACRKYLDEKGWEELVRMAESKNAKDRMWALEVMLDRGYGRPSQAFDMSVERNPFDGVSDEDLRALALEIQRETLREAKQAATPMLTHEGSKAEPERTELRATKED